VPRPLKPAKSPQRAVHFSARYDIVNETDLGDPMKKTSDYVNGDPDRSNVTAPAKKTAQAHVVDIAGDHSLRVTTTSTRTSLASGALR
jgi:hypothetical protein